MYTNLNYDGGKHVICPKSSVCRDSAPRFGRFIAAILFDCHCVHVQYSTLYNL